MEAFFNKAICCKNVPYLWGKKFRASLKVRKKQLVNRFVKILENYGPLCIFRNYANYVLRAELCNFTSAHNFGSPVNKNLLTFLQELEVDLVGQVSQDFMGSISVIQKKFSGLLLLEGLVHITVSYMIKKNKKRQRNLKKMG